MELWDKIKENWQKQTPEEKKRTIRDIAIMAVATIGAGITVGPVGAWGVISAVYLKRQIDTERKLRNKFLQAKRPMPNTLKKWKEKSAPEKLLSVAKWSAMGAACIAGAALGASGVAAGLLGSGGIYGAAAGVAMNVTVGTIARGSLMHDDIKLNNAVFKINNNKKLSPQQKKEAIQREKMLAYGFIPNHNLISVKPEDLKTVSPRITKKVAWRQPQTMPEGVKPKGRVRKLDISDILLNDGGKKL
ncbi:MAG: hypothetical protein IJ532_07245 [Alphaproteobacteria bacterium]|nr:hypothetical protein [Alphaproteobacteria bacterium]